MTTFKHMYKCDLCKNDFQHGPHRYEGHLCKLYDIVVCDTCWESNWDGWNPRHEDFLIRHLKEKGMPIPERNSKGWLPRD